MCTDVNNFTDLHRKRNIGIQKMAERAGYDQPGDEYTNKHAKFGVDVPSPYQPGIPPLQQGYGLQPNPFQQLYRDDTNTTVVVTQPQTGTVIYQQRPPDYMLVSVLACLCCFWPTGICAIYYANEANNLASAGDYAGARRMSNNAKKLIITSVVIGIIGLAVYVALQVVVINESYRSSNSY